METTSDLSQKCPFCGAPPGVMCVTARYEDYSMYGYGARRDTPHPQRPTQAPASQRMPWDLSDV